MTMVRYQLLIVKVVTSLTREGAGWVHAHFKLSGDFKGSYLSETHGIIVSFLLVTRGKFKSATAS